MCSAELFLADVEPLKLRFHGAGAEVGGLWFCQSTAAARHGHLPQDGVGRMGGWQMRSAEVLLFF